jgi:urease accessory protein
MVAARRRAVAGLGLVLIASAAEAHTPFVGVGDFYAGMLHPVTALEHVLPIVALGLLIGQRLSVRKIQWLLVVFPLIFALGATAAWWIQSLPGVTLINLLSAAVLGLLIALAWPAPPTLVYALATLFGLTHGFANGINAASGIRPLQFISGLALSVFLLLAYVAGGTDYLLKRKLGWLSIAVRVAGSWIAAVGILVVAGGARNLL